MERLPLAVLQQHNASLLIRVLPSPNLKAHSSHFFFSVAWHQHHWPLLSFPLPSPSACPYTAGRNRRGREGVEGGKRHETTNATTLLTRNRANASFFFPFLFVSFSLLSLSASACGAQEYYFIFCLFLQGGAAKSDAYPSSREHCTTHGGELA